MRRIIKRVEPIELMTVVKKTVLIYERAYGHTPTVSHLDIETLCKAVKNQQKFEAICKEIYERLTNAILAAPKSAEDQTFLSEHGVGDFMDLPSGCDFSVITDKYHPRKCFNEIENDDIINALGDLFRKIWKIPSEGEYLIEVYDLNDEPFYFHDFNDMCSFVHNYNVGAYVAFEVKDGERHELPSN